MNADHRVLGGSGGCPGAGEQRPSQVGECFLSDALDTLETAERRGSSKPCARRRIPRSADGERVTDGDELAAPVEHEQALLLEERVRKVVEHVIRTFPDGDSPMIEKWCVELL